ncbi:hypothetical protein HN51_070070, partial [Arachis hypogaea]
TQGRVIIACYFLHNHIRRVMVVDPINEIVDQNMLGVDGGINLHKKYVTNGEEDIMLDNCDHFSMCEAVYRNIDFILLMCLCSCTSVVHAIASSSSVRPECNALSGLDTGFSR